MGVLTAVTASVAAAAIIASCRWGCSRLKALARRLKQRAKGLPSETVRLVPVPGEQKLTGHESDPDAVVAYGHWNVSNITASPAYILGATLLKPRIAGRTRLLAYEWPHDDQNSIAPNGVARICAEFVLPAKTIDPGKDLQTHVEFTDHLQNPIRMRVIFKPPHGENLDPVARAPELLSDTPDPVSKNVASFLQLESNQLGQSGLTKMLVGRMPNGSTKPAFDESWSGDIPRPYVQVPSGSRLESANASGLIGYYKSLGERERTVFIEALTARLSAKTGYAPVAYLIVLVMFRLDMLPRAITTTLQQFPRGSRELVNLGSVLDQLLRWEYPSFTEQQLADIERLVGHLPERVGHLLSERIVAVHAFHARTIDSPSNTIESI